MVTIALCKKVTSPVRLVLKVEGYTFPATVLYMGVSLDLGSISINKIRLIQLAIKNLY